MEHHTPKNNQAKSFFSYKNDETELTDIGQFLRDTTNYGVGVEWYVFFDRMTGEYVKYVKAVMENTKYKIRNPDLILFNKETKKLVMVIEIDGSVHDVHFLDTQNRNEEYFYAGIPLITVTKSEIDTTIFDYITRKLDERLG
jgi:hypothetical protein